MLCRFMPLPQCLLSVLLLYTHFCTFTVHNQARCGGFREKLYLASVKPYCYLKAAQFPCTLSHTQHMSPSVMPLKWYLTLGTSVLAQVVFDSWYL